METFDLKYFLAVLGMVFFIEGIPYFASPLGVKKWLEVVRLLPDAVIRGIGFSFMLLGLTILYLSLKVLS